MFNIECETVILLNNNNIFNNLEKAIPYKDKVRRFYQTRIYWDDNFFSFYRLGASLALRHNNNNDYSYIFKWKDNILSNSISYTKKETMFKHLSYKHLKAITTNDNLKLPKEMAFIPVFFLKSYRSQFLYKSSPSFILFSLDNIEIISTDNKRIGTFHCIEIEQSSFQGVMFSDYIKLLDIILKLMPKEVEIVYPSKYHIAKSILDNQSN